MDSTTETELASLSRLDDRIVSTSNEKLSDVLRLALPALIKLVNKDELRPAVFKMFSSLMKRLKTLSDCILPLPVLISLMRQEHLPYSCNFATTFIDIVWERQSGKDAVLTAALFESILDWPLYSSQSNALLSYSWNVIEHFPAAMVLLIEKGIISSSRLEDLKHILSDYFLDLCLIHTHVVKRGGAGSVQPGLSDPRVMRLTIKKEELRAKEDLQVHKLAVLDLLLDSQVFMPWAAVAISTVLAYDTDDIVAQAASYKMTAQGSRRDIRGAEVPAITQLISHLLFLVSPTAAPIVISSPTDGSNTVTSPYSQARSSLRDEIRSHIIRWVSKEIGSRVVGCQRGALKIFVDATFTDTSSSRFRTAAVTLGNLLTEHMEVASLTPTTPLFLQGIEKTLGTFVTRAIDYDTSDGKVTRETCYAMLERIALRVPLLAIRSASAVSILFKLLDNEDENLIPKLYSSLGALREAYQSRQQNASEWEILEEEEEEVGSGSGATATASAALAAAAQASQAVRSSQTLQDVIVSARMSETPKKRLAALQWARAVFEFDRISIESMVILADDTNPAVALAVSKEFVVLCNDMDQDRADLLVNIATSSLLVSQSDGKQHRLVARMEVFRVLSSYLAISVRKRLGFSESDLVKQKSWTSIIHMPPCNIDVSNAYDSLIDLIAEDIVLEAGNAALKHKLVEESSLLLRNILLSNNNPERRSHARKFDKVLLGWLRDCDGVASSQYIADIFGTLCLDSLDTFLACAKDALEENIQISLSANSNLSGSATTGEKTSTSKA